MNKKTIKLISPKMSKRPMDSHFKVQMSPPLCLLVLAGLTPLHYKICVEDENVEKLDLNDQPDLVGITVKADTRNRSAQIAEAYRQRGIPVVMGGIHPTSCPDDCAPLADSVVVGEAEQIWPRLLHDFEGDQLQPRYHQTTPVALSDTPMPRWDLLGAKNYLFTNTLVMSRGCPFTCDFCYSSNDNIHSGYRTKGVNQILQEIESLNSRHVFFIDDNFIGSIKFTRQLLTALKPMQLTWHTAVSANIVRHDDVLNLMAEAGCKSLFIGFESVNEDNLAAYNKKQNKRQLYETLIQKVHARDMMVNASIVFGFDHDTPDVFERTTTWLIDQKVETMTAHILTPYPGTRLFSKLHKEGRIIDYNFDHYNTSYAVFTPRQMTPRELESGYKMAYKKFYSTRGILSRLPSSPNRRVPFLLFNFFYRKWGRFFSTVGKFGFMTYIGRLGKALCYGNLSTRKKSSFMFMAQQRMHRQT
jgi:radical SAM superfamily enzyme YgiQ (UPF0313 family)